MKTLQKAQFKQAMATGNYRIEKQKDSSFEARMYGMRLGTLVATKDEAKEIIRARHVASRAYVGGFS